MRSYLGALAVVAVVSACAPSLPPTIAPPPARDVFIHQPPPKVWDAALVLLTDLSIPIENMDRASWFLRTQEMTLSNPAASVDCGSRMPGQAWTSVATVLVRYTMLLRPEGDSTGVRIQVSSRFAGGDGAGECVSRGNLEGTLVDRLRARIELGHS